MCLSDKCFMPYPRIFQLNTMVASTIVEKKSKQILGEPTAICRLLTNIPTSTLIRMKRENTARNNIILCLGNVIPIGVINLNL